MYKFLIFIGSITIVYWLINGDIDFYKIAAGVLFILLGFFKEMTDYWKHEVTRYRNIERRTLMLSNCTYYPNGSLKTIKLKDGSIIHYNEDGNIKYIQLSNDALKRLVEMKQFTGV